MDFFKKHFKYIILLVFSIVSITFVYNDYFLYKTPILKIDKIVEEKYESSIHEEDYYKQKITGIIKNGKYKGKVVTVTNLRSSSGVYDIQVHKKTELMLQISNDLEVISIVNVKRDKYLVILFVIFIDTIIIVAGRKGLKTIISLLINILISALTILVFNKYYNKFNMLLIYLLVSIIFIIVSLVITNKKSRKRLAAIISSIVSLFISFSFCYLIIKIYGKDLYIWSMEYIEVVSDYENYFFVSILLSGLGAIMDIAITISSSLNELIIKNKNIKKTKLLKSGKEIGKDIVGTMSNVMLYTCFTPIIPMLFLAVKNNMTIGNAISYYGELELVTVLCSCISIVMAIPLSLLVSSFILTKRGDKND
ncbi:MAG: YibE/F family protein [Bacilli bacterium]|nr:YibE/F family protein [Bacilli bacterium]